MYYIHTTVVTDDLEQSRDFYTGALGMTAFRQIDGPEGRFRAVFIAASDDEEGARSARFSPALALLQHAEPAGAEAGISHICFRVADLYGLCERIAAAGHRFKVPPRDGFRALVHTPEGAVIEFHQIGERNPPAEPWTSMPDSD